MSDSDTNRAPGICPASYSALSPTCSRTRSGLARCAFNQPASTTRFCRGLAIAAAAIRHASTKSIFFIEVSFDDEDASGATPCRQVCSQVDWEGGEMGARPTLELPASARCRPPTRTPELICKKVVRVLA